MIADDKKLTRKMKRGNDVSAENDQLGENEYEAFRSANDNAEEIVRKGRQ